MNRLGRSRDRLGQEHPEGQATLHFDQGDSAVAQAGEAGEEFDDLGLEEEVATAFGRGVGAELDLAGGDRWRVEDGLAGADRERFNPPVVEGLHQLDEAPPGRREIAQTSWGVGSVLRHGRPLGLGRPRGERNGVHSTRGPSEARTGEGWRITNQADASGATCESVWAAGTSGLEEFREFSLL
jgi:hypothetical protein